MSFFKLNPTNQQRIKRFYSIKRGFYSFLVLILITLFTMTAEFFINNKAIVVSYNGNLHFPIFSSTKYTGVDFGEDYTFEPRYRDLQAKWKVENSKNWIIMPLVPYGKTEVDEINTVKLKQEIEKINIDFKDRFAVLAKSVMTEEDRSQLKGQIADSKNSQTAELFAEMFHPLPPSVKSKHYLGTDPIGRDIVAQLVYGYRVAIIFSLALLICTYSIGITVGCLMGYLGGWFDLIVQRIIEILSRVPFIYLMMIIASTIGRSFGVLLGLMVIFGWMGITAHMRTATYKEKARDYIMAARSLGAGDVRIIFRHIIPSTIALIVTFIPFSVSGAIITLTSLDFLGFGLPPGQPSWGDLMKIGTSNMDAPWIVSSVVFALVFVLFLVNMVGEAIREAFDPKKFTKYE